MQRPICYLKGELCICLEIKIKVIGNTFVFFRLQLWLPIINEDHIQFSLNLFKRIDINNWNIPTKVREIIQSSNVMKLYDILNGGTLTKILESNWQVRWP